MPVSWLRASSGPAQRSLALALALGLPLHRLQWLSLHHLIRHLIGSTGRDSTPFRRQLVAHALAARPQAMLMPMPMLMAMVIAMVRAAVAGGADAA